MRRLSFPRFSRVLAPLALEACALLGCSAPPAKSSPPAPSPVATNPVPAVTPPLVRAFVLPPRGDDGLLFDAELDVLQPLFLSALASQQDKPVTPLDRKEIESLLALKSAGRLSATGPLCKQPPTLERVALAQYPNLVSARLLVRCPKTCQVELTLHGSELPFMRVGNGERVLELTRDVADPERVSSYADAVRELGSPAVARRPRELGTATPPATFARTQIDRALLSPSFSDGFIALPDHMACEDGSDRALFELSATGEVGRCENRSALTGARPCDLCTSLRSIPQTRGVAGRRALITTISRVVTRGTDGRVSVGSRYPGPARSWLTTRAGLAQDDRDALARINESVLGCVSPRRYATPADVGPMEVSAKLLMALSADGGVASVTCSDLLGLRAPEQGCFESKLREVGFPCPLGGATLALDLRGERAISY